MEMQEKKITMAKAKMHFVGIHLIITVLYFLTSGTLLSSAIALFICLENGVMYWYCHLEAGANAGRKEVNMANYIFYGVVSILHFIAMGFMIYLFLNDAPRAATAIGFVICSIWAVIFGIAYMVTRSDYKKLLKEIDK